MTPSSHLPAVPWSPIAVALGLASFAAWIVGSRLVWALGHAATRARTGASFARAIELRVPALAGKAEATARLAVVAADRAGLGPLRAERLRLAARLADIGYAAVPYGALNGALNGAPPDAIGLGEGESGAAESAISARHPAIGAAILELVPGAAEVADLVRRHHDRDPDIPLEHRILVAACAVVERQRAGLPACEPDPSLVAPRKRKRDAVPL